MDSIKDILSKFDPTRDKYISREYQSFGVHLAEKLGDERRKALYIKLAKQLPRPVLEQALRFVVDSNARKKGALFMWKLKELGVLGDGKKKANDPHTTLLRKPRAKKKKSGEVKTSIKKIKKTSSSEQLSIE